MPEIYLTIDLISTARNSEEVVAYGKNVRCGKHEEHEEASGSPRMVLLKDHVGIDVDSEGPPWPSRSQ